MLLLAWLPSLILPGLAVYLRPSAKDTRQVLAAVGNGVSTPSTAKAGPTKPKGKPVSGYDPGVDYGKQGPVTAAPTVQGGAFQADETDNSFRERDPESLFTGDPTTMPYLYLVGAGA